MSAPAEKQKSVKREAEPEIEYDNLDPLFRTSAAKKFDEKFPSFTHSWAKAGTAEKHLRVKGQEAVKQGGDLVEDPLGDFLVRQPRERFELLRERERQMSLDTISAVVNVDDPEMSDLEQVAKAKEVRHRPIR